MNRKLTKFQSQMGFIQHQCASAGFSLIEVLVASVLICVVGGGLLAIQSILSKNQVNVIRNYISVDEANTNISTLVRELRNTRTGDNGAYPLEQALDQEIIFYSDIDFDGQTERVRYFLSETQLTKGVIEPQGFPVTYPSEIEKVKVVSENVRNGATPIFYYYNGDWPSDTTNNPLDTPTRLSETKLMNVYLELNPNENNPERNYILQSYVQIRTLKDNL
ncbi:prepilin-type N-terminal cleavage/methylation domain-containing protein [Patescibacteria group bacterium]|nr:prepilin-type N-terminal cleavage/methylation domain-containing protein [Patescibacteria group bacterium]